MVGLTSPGFECGAGELLCRLHVWLVEGVDADAAGGDRCREFPAEEFARDSLRGQGV